MRLAPEVVAAMQQLAVEQRRLVGPRAPWHVGDIAWNLRQHEGREDEWRIRLWVEDGRTVAWSWLQRDGGVLEHDVHPDHLHLLDEILAEPEAHTASASADDAKGRAALARHGFQYRTVGSADIPERVAIHREVWSRPGKPSRVTEPSFTQVRPEWPYRESLDCAIEGPDGSFVASCLCWLDAESLGFRPHASYIAYAREGRALSNRP